MLSSFISSLVPPTGRGEFYAWGQFHRTGLLTAYSILTKAIAVLPVAKTDDRYRAEGSNAMKLSGFLGSPVPKYRACTG